MKFVTELGFELVNPGSAVRRTTDCIMETGQTNIEPTFLKPYHPS